MEEALLVVLGAAVTLLAGFASAAVSRSHALERWLREERKVAYVAVLAETSHFITEIAAQRQLPQGDAPPLDLRVFDALATAVATVELLGPPRLARIADGLAVAVVDAFDSKNPAATPFAELRKEFLVMASRELGVAK